VRKLTPGHLRALYAKKLEAGLAPRTVQYIHAVMHRALKQAARDSIAARNVAELVDRPRAERKEMRVLTPAQIATFLNAAEGDRLAALYRLAITTGMR
jgi:integrase